MARPLLAQQQVPTQIPGQSAGPTAGSFQGSVTAGQATGQTLNLSLDDAMQRGLKNNLGAILSGTQTDAARAQRLTELQALLPDVEFNAHEAVSQVDLAAQGLRIPGFPTIIGPFGYTDLRGYLTWSLLDLKSLRTYMAAKHQFTAAHALGTGCARHGGADGRQCLHAGAGRSRAWWIVSWRRWRRQRFLSTRRMQTTMRERRRDWTSCVRRWIINRCSSS